MKSGEGSCNPAPRLPRPDCIGARNDVCSVLLVHHTSESGVWWEGREGEHHPSVVSLRVVAVPGGPEARVSRAPRLHIGVNGLIDGLHLPVPVVGVEVRAGHNTAEDLHDLLVVVNDEVGLDGHTLALPLRPVVHRGLEVHPGDEGLQVVGPHLVPTKPHARPDVQRVAIVYEALEALFDPRPEEPVGRDDGVV
ncbi:MAG: hypothetical protein HY666_03885, partial [Chloroflexi bacterium]|nr:hypothetical protein [Chloroflexota bacterium]